MIKINCFRLGLIILFSLVLGLFPGSEIGMAVTPAQIQSVIKTYNPTITESQSLQIAYSLEKWTVARNLNFITSLALVVCESHFDSNALSETGAKGLWQLKEKAIKELERRYGVSIDRSRLFEIDYNCCWGTLYFRLCALLAKGDREEAIARYYYTTEWRRAEDYVEKVMAVREKIADLIREK
ncbi:hypothetical protein ES703_22562 [subsurface metagenome]